MQDLVSCCVFSVVLPLTHASTGTVCHNLVGCWQDGNCLIHQWNQVPIPDSGRTDLLSWAVKSASNSLWAWVQFWQKQQTNHPNTGHSTSACAISTQSLPGFLQGAFTQLRPHGRQTHRVFQWLDFIFWGSLNWRNLQYGCVCVCVCFIFGVSKFLSSKIQ